jgi:hypothetical protein
MEKINIILSLGVVLQFSFLLLSRPVCLGFFLCFILLVLISLLLSQASVPSYVLQQASVRTHGGVWCPY